MGDPTIPVIFRVQSDVSDLITRPKLIVSEVSPDQLVWRQVLQIGVGEKHSHRLKMKKGKLTFGFCYDARVTWNSRTKREHHPGPLLTMEVFFFGDQFLPFRPRFECVALPVVWWIGVITLPPALFTTKSAFFKQRVSASIKHLLCLHAANQTNHLFVTLIYHSHGLQLPSLRLLLAFQDFFWFTWYCVCVLAFVVSFLFVWLLTFLCLFWFCLFVFVGLSLGFFDVFLFVICICLFDF